ncbi:unnamed protein product [Sphagnum jensenii]|jgi:hypothetical protein|uniref:Uncharacterized protein n=1 Tax=Sphagnum jensenii TaxID=128206 RepID=A0ABP0VPI7_9BRYO
MSSPSWAHERSRVSGTSSELSTNPEVGFGVATSSALTTSSSSPRSGGDVKVIACLVDATDRILTKYALDFAVFQCASRGDTVFLLGLLQGIKVGSAVRRGSGPLDSEVEQVISDTRRMYQAKLRDFLSQAEKREIKLEVKIGVGPAFKEIIALGANWVILDSDMGIHRQAILDRTNCGLVEMTTDHKREVTRIYDPFFKPKPPTPRHDFSSTSDKEVCCCFSFCCH